MDRAARAGTWRRCGRGTDCQEITNCVGELIFGSPNRLGWSVCVSAESVVVSNQLTKRYGEFTALDQLTIHVEAGQILGFIGPNGAGKTTAIRILVGLLRPTSGTATIAGADCVRDARRIKRLVGYMPQQVIEERLRNWL